ncbi:MAG: DUF4394 domain-containing protein [Tepidisphaeraceae bacterium]
MWQAKRSKRTIASRVQCVVESLESRRLLSGDAIGLTGDNMLVSIKSGSPEKTQGGTAIMGLAAGEEVVGIDYRAANGQLYGLVDGAGTDRIILIDAKTGASTPVFSLTTQLVGDEFGVDFNPVADALRITSDADQNLRVPFASGATIVDGALAYGAADANAGDNPNVVGSAYTNSFPGTTTTQLFNIDSGQDVQVLQSPPNAGTLSTIGSLGVNTDAPVGFDIRAADSAANYEGEALASLTLTSDATSDVGSRLYSINLATGAATEIGTVGSEQKGYITLRGLTLVPADAQNNNRGGLGAVSGNRPDSAEEDDEEDGDEVI